MRAKFTGSAEKVINLFSFIAEDVRHILASLGVRTLAEVIGRTDMLQQVSRGSEYLDDLDLNPLLVQADPGPHARYCTLVGRNEVPETLDAQMIADAAALFERGDVDGILTIEPTASRLVGRGAREIARVGDQWNAGTGQTGLPFLVGLAASRRWLDANHDLARKIAALFVKTNTAIRAKPALLRDVTADLGLKPDETRAAALIPQRLTESFAKMWDTNVFGMIDKQIDVALELGILAKRPAGKMYVTL